MRMKTENSYKKKIGIANKIWLKRSGGDNIAPINKDKIIKYFLYLIKISGVTNPTFVKKYIIIGNSNTIPQANEDDLTNPINELRSISFNTSLDTW